MRCDRSREDTGKRWGGGVEGVSVFVNEQWCSNVTLKEQHCCTDAELLTQEVSSNFCDCCLPKG